MPATTAAQPAKSPLRKVMDKLGLLRDIDLALHLPLRYEDETRLVRLCDARDGESVQMEGEVTASEVKFRPRRQLLVTLYDGSDTCTLRFFNFYPAQQKMLAIGARVRVRGEVQGGFVGKTMVHPVVHAADTPLPTALTPVYPTGAGLPQAYLRKAVLGGLARADVSETVDREQGLPHHEALQWSLRDALAFLHQPSPDVALPRWKTTATQPGNA